MNDPVVYIPIIISVLLLITTIISTYAAIYYKRKEIKMRENEIEFSRMGKKGEIRINEKITVFTEREVMLDYIHSMFKNAKSNDVIWGQSVSGNSYGDADKEILSAKKRNVKFEMILRSDVVNPTNLKHDLKKALDIVNGLVVLRDDSKLRIQGLSTSEVVISIPTELEYRAILIKDEGLAEALRYWFQMRLNLENDNDNEDVKIYNQSKL